MKIHRPLLAAVVALYGFGFAACSGGSSGDDSANNPLGNGSSSGSSSGSSGSGSGSGGGDDAGADATLGGGDDGGTEIPSDGGPIMGKMSTGNSCAALNNTQTSFVNLAVPMGSPLDKTENDPVPSDAGTTPSGWNFYQIDGALCRDGSPTGFYVRYGTVNKLMIYLEGGGACMSPHFCDHNPPNMATVFPGGNLNGESFSGSLVTQAGLQAPYTSGIFDTTQPTNPFLNWSQVYVPYCTGDSHFGTNDNARVQDGVNPLVTNTWHFVGYLNMQKFVSRLVATFTSLDQVILTGSSAGGLGAGLNYGLVQDSFGSVPVTVIDDSFPPFRGDLISACLQGIVRPLWGLDSAIPADCAECAADAGGLANVVKYWHHKYSHAKVGLVSTVHDQVIRLFLAAGQNNCMDTDPNLLSTLGLQGGDIPSFDGGMYANGLTDLRTTYECTGALSSYYIGAADPDASDMNGSIDTLHEHIFRDRFYDPLAGPGQPTLAAWVGDFVTGKLSQVGP
jgi:hypothetical protein